MKEWHKAPDGCYSLRLGMFTLSVRKSDRAWIFYLGCGAIEYHPGSASDEEAQAAALEWARAKLSEALKDAG